MRQSTPSPFHDPAVVKAGGFFERARLGRHKHSSDWRSKLNRAKQNWENPAHDDLIKENGSSGNLHPDEVDVAIRWECFRHLYFTDGISDFWRNVIEGDRFDALEVYKNSLSRIGFLGDEADCFAAPWNAWADNPCFPSLTWMEAKAKPEFNQALHSAPRAAAPARLLMDTVSSWSLFHHWSLDQIESSETLRQTDEAAANERLLQGMIRPMEIERREPNVTAIAMEINWKASKEEIQNSFWQQIESIWKRQNPKGVRGPRTKDLPFFKGLVMIRGCRRGTAPDIYKSTSDGLESKASRDARKLAADRLDDTRRELEAIEARLQKV